MAMEKIHLTAYFAAYIQTLSERLDISAPMIYNFSILKIRRATHEHFKRFAGTLAR